MALKLPLQLVVLQLWFLSPETLCCTGGLTLSSAGWIFLHQDGVDY